MECVDYELLNFHVYANSLIVKEYKERNHPIRYEVVKEVGEELEDGNVQVTDGYFEGTPLAILDYLHPKSLIQKGFKKFVFAKTSGIKSSKYKGDLSGKKNSSVGNRTQETAESVKPNDVVPYRPTNSPLENHHGLMDVWAKHNTPNYVSRGANTPTLALTKDQHDATKVVYRQWLYEKTGRKVGGKVDWQSVSPREMQEFTEKMFEAAKVPKLARQEYYNALNLYNYRE